MTEFRKKKKKYPYPFLRQFHADGRFSTRVHHQLRFLINAKNGSDGKKKERERVKGGGGTFSQGEIPGNGSGSR